MNFADFKYVFRFFISCFHPKLQPSKVGPFCLLLPVFDHFKPTLQSCSVWSKKDIKNLNTYLKSAKFKVSEKFKLKFFKQVEKNLHFFLLHFSFSFSNSSKTFISLYSSAQNYLFNEVLLSIISFFLQEELTKMCGLPELLE